MESEKKRVCKAPSCSKDGSKLRCPDCSKFSVNSNFCSQDCFKSVWKQHKKFHAILTNCPQMFAAMTQEERDSFESEFTGGNFFLGQYYVGNRNENGQKHGKGTLYWINGSIYEGDFSFDKQHGYGKHSMFNGDVYEGEFKNDQMHGHGVYRWADGGEYTGSFHKDKMHGQGLRTWKIGASHEGEYKAGLRYGPGKMTHANGDVFVGIFENDLRKEGKLNYANGDVYTGSFMNELPHGEGTLTKAKGRSFTGRFRNGKLSNSTSDDLTFSQLTVGKVHSGQSITGTIVHKPFKMNAIQLTVQDSEGSEMTVSVYNYPGYKGAISQTLDINSMRNPQTFGLDQGKTIRIHNPYCKVAMSGAVVIRVDDFSTIEIL